ncbi:MAG: RDD family protein [Actinobacteria bacterium]|nr:RDD family protein [Actinomycetota bacterium]
MTDPGAPPPPAPGVPGIPTPPPNVPGPLASWGDRVGSTLVDAIFVLAIYIVVWIVSLILGAISDTLGGLFLVIGYIAAFGYSFYLGYLEGETGQSPGKAITGLKVVRVSDGGLIGGGSGILRRLAYILDGF